MTAASVPSAAQLLTHCYHSALILRTVCLTNVVHYAQDRTGITTLIFFAYMRDYCARQRLPTAFPKMVNSIDIEVSSKSISISMGNSQHSSWLNLYHGWDRHVYLFHFNHYGKELCNMLQLLTSFRTFLSGKVFWKPSLISHSFIANERMCGHPKSGKYENNWAQPVAKDNYFCHFINVFQWGKLANLQPNNQILNMHLRR